MAPARRPWSRRCSPRREPSPARAPSARAPRCATSRSPSTPTDARSPSRSRRSSTTASRSTSIDTPGYADFVGELRAGLRAADCALFVIAANEGVDDATRSLWRECADVGMPRAVIVTKLDQARADYDGVLAQAQASFGDKVMPLYLPVRDGGEVVSLTGLLAPGDAARRRPARPADRGRDRGVRGRDPDGPLPRWRGDRREGPHRRPRARRRRGRRSSPSYPSARSPASAAPSCSTWPPAPSRRRPSTRRPRCSRPAGKAAATITCDPDGPLVAEVVKTTSDPYVGRLSLVRVFSGTLRPDESVHVSGHFTSFFGADAGHEDHDEDERLGALTHPFGRPQCPADPVVAGDLAAIARLTRAETGDTLSSVDDPRVLRPWSLPEPLLPIAIVARSKADEDKLPQALGRLAAEDPSIRVDNDAETHQLVMWCMGESHADVVLERLEGRYAVHVDQEPFVVVAARDVRRPGRGHGPARQAVRRARPVRRVRHRGGAAARGVRLRVRRQGRRRLGAPAVHPERGEGGPRADGARRTPRLSGRRPAGDPHRRQVAQRRLLRHGLPDRRRAGAARGRRHHLDHDAGAVRHRRGGRARRPGRRRDERPVRPAGTRARHRQGRRRPDAGAGRGAADRAGPLRHRPALRHPRLRHLHPVLRPLRADARRRRRDQVEPRRR